MGLHAAVAVAAAVGARAAKIDTKRVIEVQTEEEQQLSGAHWLEWTFQMCDEVTRRTGRLTKTTRFVDMKNSPMRNMSREFMSRDSKSAKETEDFYPQMLASVYICHPPYWMHGVWKIFRPLFPKRFVEKIDLISPTTNKEEAARPLRLLKVSHLPERFGGSLAQWPSPLHNRLPADFPPIGLVKGSRGAAFT